MEHVEAYRSRPNRAPNRGSESDMSGFTHPGPADEKRVLWVGTVEPCRDVIISVRPGQNVGASINAALNRIAEKAAGCGRVMSGGFSRVQYHVMTKAREGVKPYVYGTPIVINGESTVISSAINMGHRADASRILHCHGGFIDEMGSQHGGHIILDNSVAGGAGLQIRLALFGSVDFVVSLDEETTFELLQPVPQS